MASEVARFLRDKYRKSLREVESRLPASLLREFRDIEKQLEDSRFFSSPTPEFISLLYDLNDAVAEWRFLKQQRKDVKKKERLIKQLKSRVGDPSSLLISSQTSFPSDRYTCFEQHPPNFSGFGESEEKMVDWLTASPEGLKAIGVYGMGGSGKTALVKKVLKHPRVSAEFNNNIVWACFSDITCKDEVDIKIVKYLLEHLGCDVDSLDGYRNDEVWLLEQLKLKLLDLNNYIVVFDDVWLCNDWFVGLCHKLGEPRKMDPKLDGAVIVTSRIKEVAEKIVGRKNLIHLTPLDYNENRKFLEDVVKQHMKDADADADADANANANLVDEIVRHCHGLPQPAKTLADVVAGFTSQ